MVYATSCRACAGSRGRGIGLDDEGDAELAEGSGGRSVATSTGREDTAEAARNGRGTLWKRDGALGRHRGHGKSSNARLVTVKAKEGAGKANDSLPCARRGIMHRSDPARLDT
jgi:hypothetical protein